MVACCWESIASYIVNDEGCCWLALCKRNVFWLQGSLIMNKSRNCWLHSLLHILVELCTWSGVIEKLIVLRNSLHFMKPRYILPCSPESTTSSYPGPDESTLFLPSSPKIDFNIIPPNTPCLSGGLFPSGFSTKYCVHYSSPPHVLHALPISSSSIWWS